MLALFSIGVGIGSLLCERLSGHKVEIGLVPFGSIGMTVFGLDLYFARPQRDECCTICPRSAFLGAGQLAHRARLGPDRRVRRLLHRAAVRARAEPHRPQRAVARDRRQQHPQRAVHGRRGGFRHRPRRALGLSIPQIFLVAARAQRRRRHLHLHAGSRIPHAVPVVDPGQHAVPDRSRRARQHSRARARRCSSATTSATWMR